jgi:DNA replication protein DnaC
MLSNQTADKFRSMKLPAMAAEYIRQAEFPGMAALDFDERVGMMADAEWTSRLNSRIKKLTADAKLRIPGACFSDIDYRPSRKIDRGFVARLSDFGWIREARNLIITGPTGTGKTWMACAFGAEACRKSMHAAYFRVSRLLGELAAASTSGNLPRLLAKLKRTDILILDDWGMSCLNPFEGRLLLEVFEDRFGERSTIIAAQLPVANWHGTFEESMVADALMDRVANNSYRLELHGPSLRREGAASNGASAEPSADVADMPISGVNAAIAGL